MSDKTRMVHLSPMRFGLIAVQKGFITPDQLCGGLAAQVQVEIEQGTHQLIGEILHDQGAMTMAQIDEVLQTLEELRRAFQR